MEERKKGKSPKKILKKMIGIVIMLGLGVVMGILMTSVFEMNFADMKLTDLFVSLFLIFLAYFLEVIMHEGGHLITGLMTGYRFSSFRVGSCLLVRKDGKFRIRKFSIPGTLGQCLLIPPERDGEGRYPYFFYNLGGILVNIITALIAFLIIHFTGVTGYLGVFLWGFVLVGLFMAVENGIPLGGLGITNDGANIRSCMKEPLVRDSLWRQLTINALQTEEVLLADMDPALFEMPTDEEMGNMWVSARAVFVENLYMEEMKTEEARFLIDHLLYTKGIKLIPIYESLIRLDRIFIMLMQGEGPEVTKEDRKNMKGFMAFPSCLRSTYAVNLLVDKDEKAAEKTRKLFDKTIEGYPFITDRAVEPKYMAMIDEKYKEMKEKTEA